MILQCRAECLNATSRQIAGSDKKVFNVQEDHLLSFKCSNGPDQFHEHFFQCQCLEFGQEW